MNQHDPFDGEIVDDEPVKIPVNDKRRFTEEGIRDDVQEEKAPNTPQKSPREIELEAKLKNETERREAAEAKLVGVQAKFDEAKSNLEKETADMRARLMKTLEDRSKQGQFNFLITLLPVLDNLNLAIAASCAADTGDASIALPSLFSRPVRSLITQFAAVLASRAPATASKNSAVARSATSTLAS